MNQEVCDSQSKWTSQRDTEGQNLNRFTPAKPKRRSRCGRAAPIRRTQYGQAGGRAAQAARVRRLRPVGGAASRMHAPLCREAAASRAKQDVEISHPRSARSSLLHLLMIAVFDLSKPSQIHELKEVLRNSRVSLAGCCSTNWYLHVSYREIVILNNRRRADAARVG